LRDYHAIGEQIQMLASDPKVGVRGTGWRKQLATLLGISESMLNKYQQFFAKYDLDELARLEAAGFTFGRLTIAHAVEDKEARYRLLEQAKKEGWTDPELQRQLQARNGSRRGGGRPRKGPKGHGLVPDVNELVRLMRPLSAFNTQIWSVGQDSYQREISSLPEKDKPSLARQVMSAREMLQTLLRQVVQGLDYAESLEQMLSPVSGVTRKRQDLLVTQNGDSLVA